MIILTAILCLYLFFLVLEARKVKKSVSSIDHRIHVNGTRGKSTVTEYIAAALYDTESPTLAKITGVQPSYLVDGHRELIKRQGSARVQEQFRTINKAARLECKNLVLECMSVNPLLQEVESRFFKPQIYIITNTREDHLEERSRNSVSQMEAFCRAIPNGATVVTADKACYEGIESTANEKNFTLVFAQSDTIAIETVSEKEQIFQENLSVALSVAKLCGVTEIMALGRIQKHIENKQSQFSILDYENNISFLNGFDVNDVESASAFLEQWKEKNGSTAHISIIFNTRADRPMRTDVFAKWLPEIENIDKILLAGDHRKRAMKTLRSKGFQYSKIFAIKKNDISKGCILSQLKPNTLLLSLGNIAGDGFQIINALK